MSRSLAAIVPPQDRGKPLVAATPYAWRDPSSIPPRAFVYGTWLLRGTVTAVVAPGGIGKTTLLTGTALSLVTDRELHGKKVWGGPLRVWIWNLEDDLDELARAIQGAALRFGITEEDVLGRLYVDSALDGAELTTAIEEEGEFKLLAPVFDAIVAELKARGIDVLIIDPFVSSHSVDENANSKIDKIVKAWARVAKAADVAIVLVHHARKTAGTKVTAETSRGASALVNACRAALVLNRMEEHEAERLGIEGDDERRRYFTVQDDKHNRAPPEKAAWFRLASVKLDNGRDDAPGDSVGVAEPWSPPDAFAGMTGDHLYRVQLALAEGEHREDYQSPAWAGVAVAGVLKLDHTAKADRIRIRKLIETWVAEGALQVVERPDRKRNMRRWIEVGRWANDTSAPPRNGEAGQGGAEPSRKRPTTPPPPEGGGGWGSAATAPHPGEAGQTC